MIRRLLFPAAGTALLAAGLGKALGSGSYTPVFQGLGWTRSGMRILGVAEMAGGLMMLCSQTRRTGGMITAAASVVAMASELDKRRTGLAKARVGVLAAGLLAVLAPTRRANFARKPC